MATAPWTPAPQTDGGMRVQDSTHASLHRVACAAALALALLATGCPTAPSDSTILPAVPAPDLRQGALQALAEQERMLAEAGEPLCAEDVYAPLSESDAIHSARLAELSRVLDEAFRGGYDAHDVDGVEAEGVSFDLDGARRDLRTAGDALERLVAHVRAMETLRAPERSDGRPSYLFSLSAHAIALATARCALPETTDEARLEMGEVLLALSAKARPMSWVEYWRTVALTRSYACDIAQQVLEPGSAWTDERRLDRLDSLLAEPIVPRLAAVNAIERMALLRRIRAWVSAWGVPGGAGSPPPETSAEEFAESLDQLALTTHMISRAATADVETQDEAAAAIDSRRSTMARCLQRLGLGGDDPAGGLVKVWSSVFERAQGADAQAALTRAALAVRRAERLAATSPAGASSNWARCIEEVPPALTANIVRTCDATGLHLVWSRGRERLPPLGEPQTRRRRRLVWTLAPRR